MSPERIIHIIQNVRHATPAWTDGYALRLLTRPAARIAINQIVMNRIAPYLDARALAEVIPIGHDFGYFSTERESGLHSPVRVAYTGWKSDLGARLERKLSSEKFEVRGISHHVSWQELSELYRWADVFLSTPGPEEGLYLPGLEAMAAGAIVITPDAGGNMAYCRPGDNCVLVGLEQVDDYADALASVSGWDDERIRSVRASARRTTEEFDLSREREAFGAFLDRLRPRIACYEGAGRHAASTWRRS
jgi:glycosyltransferase involved in cell wall biosynthesis